MRAVNCCAPSASSVKTSREVMLEDQRVEGKDREWRADPYHPGSVILLRNYNRGMFFFVSSDAVQF